MSIATELDKLKTRRDSIVSAINDKGGTCASGASLAECATAIAAIPIGGGSSWTGHADEVGLKSIGWTDEDVEYYQKHGVCWNEEDDALHKVSDDNIALYTNATKVTVEGVEMADSSNLSTFKSSKACQYLPKIDISALTSLSFNGCSRIIAIPKLQFTNKITTLFGVFGSCTNLTSVDVSSWDTSKVTFAYNAFSYCSSLKEIDVSKWDTAKIENMQNMFSQCRALQSIDVSSWDTSKVTTMNSMFGDCFLLEEIDVSKWNTAKVTNIEKMFQQCYALRYIDISGFDMSNIGGITMLFANCYNLCSARVNGINTSNISNMPYLFSNCYNLRSIDVSSWDTSKVTTMYNMFSSCQTLISVKFSGNFQLSAITQQSYLPSLSSAPIASCDFDTIKSIFTAIIASTMSFSSPAFTFASGSIVNDDEEGTLDDLMAQCIEKGWTISNLTIN